MSDVEFHLIAYDEASSVVESLGSTMSTTFQNIEGQTEALAETTNETASQMSTAFQNVEGQTQSLATTTEAATSQISLDYDDVQFSMNALNEAQGSAQSSFGSSAMSMNSCALAGANLYMSFDRIQNAQVSLDRANLVVEKSTNAVQSAQEAYNTAVVKYGPNSQQATDAANKLSTAEDALTVAHERVGVAQNNMNNTMIMSAVMVIPSLISIIGTVSHAQEIWTGIQWALNAAMDANPIAIIMLAIAGLVAVIIAAYTYCTPFRDAINDLGAALSGAFLAAVNAVRDALTWIWNAISNTVGFFKQLWDTITGNPILAVLLGPITTIAYLIEHWGDVVNAFRIVWEALGAAWNAVCSSISSFWNSYIKPIVDFIVGVFIADVKLLMSIWQDAQNVWTALCNAISSIWNATVGPVVSAVKWFADTIHGIFETLFGWIVGGSVWADLCGGLLTIWNDTIGPLIGAVQGFCNAVVGFFQGAASVLTGVWNGIVGGVTSAWNTITGAVSSVGSAISGGLNAVGNAVGGAAGAVGGAMSTVESTVKGGLSAAGSAISNFIGSICFAHALASAAGDSQKTMTDWASMMGEKMGKGLDAIKNFNAGAEITGAGAPAAVSAGGLGPVSAGARAPNIYITAPLVQIQGSADKATAKLAADLVKESLQNVIIQPTSGGSPYRKQIRISYNP